ncbi:uncharacterized protein LOC126746495 [Anthonomus grandis grandis]|uniref:uncharacterized protein LOC126746495 n=1 Tax=Anthonomus grandis grandis TaxID=2921223 RepID=UPI002165D21A|nr:uncharacterized protein LOC126746495 [Anthonomus grandis grandis]
MEYIASYFYKSKKIEQKDSPRVGVLELYLERVLRILTWESTEKTLKVFFLLNTLFWVNLMINLRFYGVISLLTLIIFIFDNVVRDRLYAEHTGQYASIIGDLREGFYNMFTIIGFLRRDSPLVFYSSTALFFMTLQMIGRSVPGEFIIYLVFLGIFFLPAGLSLLPEPVIAYIQTVTKELVTPRHLLAEDELMPFIQEKDPNTDPELESLLTDRSQDSFISNLASGLQTMPSYLEVAGVPDEIQEEDLIPYTNKPGVTHSPGDSSTDSESEQKGLFFDSDHFNGSSSEEDFTRGMPRTISEGLPQESAPSMFRSMLSTMGNNVVVNMFQSAIVGSSQSPSEPRRRIGSDSDSDFEIVNADEVADGGASIEKDK